MLHKMLILEAGIDLSSSTCASLFLLGASEEVTKSLLSLFLSLPAPPGGGGGKGVFQTFRQTVAIFV